MFGLPFKEPLKSVNSNHHNSYKPINQCSSYLPISISSPLFSFLYTFINFSPKTSVSMLSAQCFVFQFPVFSLYKTIDIMKPFIKHSQTKARTLRSFAILQIREYLYYDPLDYHKYLCHHIIICFEYRAVIQRVSFISFIPYIRFIRFSHTHNLCVMTTEAVSGEWK